MPGELIVKFSHKVCSNWGNVMLPCSGKSFHPLSHPPPFFFFLGLFGVWRAPSSRAMTNRLIRRSPLFTKKSSISSPSPSLDPFSPPSPCVLRGRVSLLSECSDCTLQVQCSSLAAVSNFPSTFWFRASYNLTLSFLLESPPAFARLSKFFAVSVLARSWLFPVPKGSFSSCFSSQSLLLFREL